MKAEERKELKQNTLVATLEKAGHAIKQGPSRRTAVVFGILLLVVLLFAVWKIAANVSAGRNSKRWEELYAATSPDDLRQLIDKHGETVQGRAARLQLARQNLNEGLGDSRGDDHTGILSDFEKGSELLRRAADSFEKLAKEYKATPILVQECLFGAAQAREALGEFDAAIQLYKEVGAQQKKGEPGPLAKDAAAGAKRVETKKAELEKVMAQLKKAEK